jgi:hypothetical protein
MKNRTTNRPTLAVRLLNILADGQWHSTRVLARSVGHTFCVGVFHLRQLGYLIERRRHPSRRFQFQYRLTGRKTVRQRVRSN